MGLHQVAERAKKPNQILRGLICLTILSAPPLVFLAGCGSRGNVDKYWMPDDIEIFGSPSVTGSAHTFSLEGLISPATVAETVFVRAPNVPTTARVMFYLDKELKTTETSWPFWLGGQSGEMPLGFSVDSLKVGPHTLQAVAVLSDGTIVASNVIALSVVRSINANLSKLLSTYKNQTSAQEISLGEVLENTTTKGAVLTDQEFQTREKVLTMFMNWGIDPSLDGESDQSAILAVLAPHAWKPAPYPRDNIQLSLIFSPDSPFYQRIPSTWPRVALPKGYIKTVQLNTAYNGDGIGYGEVVAKQSDPQITIRSEYYSNANTLRIFSYPMPRDWSKYLPTNPNGDSHMIFVGPQRTTFVSSYKTTRDPNSGGPDALYASTPVSLGGLGDRGGSTASQFAELPLLLQPGEATNPSRPIAHAIGGPVARTWAARVYPASAWDAGLKTSTNSCTGTGYTNTGLVPYGGVIQLDPTVQLDALGLSLPAFRILEAIQTYGYYVMDFGCADLDIYTSISEDELKPYGGLWGNNGNWPGVQNEIQRVLAAHTLYVVAPLMKKQ